MNLLRWLERTPRMSVILHTFTIRKAGILICGAVAWFVSCSPNRQAPILLFNGAGTSRGDVAALAKILRGHQFGYSMVDSWRLDAMSESQSDAHQLLIVPKGNFVEIGEGLAPATAANIRNAVRGGLDYLGICGGAFLAGSFPSPYNSFNLSSGVKFGFYSAERIGTRKAPVKITTALGPALDQYWEDGPQLSGWGDVVGKYPDGTPAIVEASVGEGWAILSGVHPEAPESWRGGMTFTTPASLDNAYLAMLIDAALRRTPLAHF